LDVIKLKFQFRQNIKIKVASLVAYLVTMFVPSQCIDADIQKLNIETHVQRNKILTVYCSTYVRLVDKKNWDKNDNYSNRNLANLHRLIQACEQIG
jgi:hypothetical protein